MVVSSKLMDPLFFSTKAQAARSARVLLCKAVEAIQDFKHLNHSILTKHDTYHPEEPWHPTSR